MKKRSEPIILVESNSPITPVQAFAEENENNIYFYLWIRPATEHSEIRSCWVCNTKKAPINQDVSSMEKGMAPMLHAEFCKNPNCGETIDKNNLSIVWLPDGDGAALLENEKLLCYIPAWSGEECRGYSRFCKGQSFVAWEMNEECERNLLHNVNKAKEFWQFFDGDYWTNYQKNMYNSIASFLDGEGKYFAIDGGKFPPKALVAGQHNNNNFAITLGVSLFPQPKVDIYYSNAKADFLRIEIAVACKSGTLSKESIQKLLNFTASISNLPWYELSCLGHGHTINCPAIDEFPQVMFINSSVYPDIPVPDFSDFMGDHINVLWIVPITEAEFQKCSTIQNGSLDLLKNYSGDISELVIFDGKPKFIKG